MFFKLIKSYFIAFAISIAVFLIGYLICLVFYTSEIASKFTNSFVWRFNGILIITTGYGALIFALRTFKEYYHSLIYNIFEIKESNKIEIFSALQNLWNYRNKQYISLMFLLVGSIILFLCGYPHSGFPKYYLWITSSSLFYVGGLMFAYLIYAIILFNKIEKFGNKIILQKNTTIIELCKTFISSSFDNFESFFFLNGLLSLSIFLILFFILFRYIFLITYLK